MKGQGLSKLGISRVIVRVTPFRALITLLITYLLSPLPLQVVLFSLSPTQFYFPSSRSLPEALAGAEPWN